MASPDATILLIVDHKKNWKILIPVDFESIIAHLMMLNDVLVYETKIHSQKVERDGLHLVDNLGNSTLWGNPRTDV